MFMPPLTLSTLRQRCGWAPFGDRLPWEDRCNFHVHRTALVADGSGVPLPVDGGLLRQFRQLKVSHTPQSAPVLHCLFRLAADPVGFQSQMVSTVLTLVGICIWWKHAQQSVIEDVGDTFVVGVCSRGKRRVRGSRPALRWAAPRFCGPSQCILKRWSLCSACCEACLFTCVNNLKRGRLRSLRQWFGLIEGWPGVSQKAFA